ncbi:hypothetical protein OBBRIDRAFT_813720 [Obba rivulosa]|uniref:Uncharacterized protein n=1 Tax=Obba rivulosa TaxID=1052685 RepID=A0A8E2DIT1_9APHY|nr:hypothetical protein OBBRIDRAFT_813720 [Obba rivulosa]
MNPRTFATGGYDHVVHLWKLTEDSQGAIASPLAIRHASLVQSLLPICDTSCKLVSAGADCSVHLWDLSSERVVNTMKTSNSVYHVHKTLTSFSTLLEVAHRELQFEVRDHRLVPERPVQRFGYEASKPHGRDGIFACGDREGNVRLWDLRNTAHALQVLPAVSGRKLAQVIFSDNYLVASSEDQRLAFMPCFGQP